MLFFFWSGLRFLFLGAKPNPSTNVFKKEKKIKWAGDFSIAVMESMVILLGKIYMSIIHGMLLTGLNAGSSS